MNQPTGNPAPSTVAGDAPTDWREALIGLVSARVELLQLEGRIAARHGARKALFIVVAAILLLFTWGLVLAGGIAAIAAVSGWAWYWVALCAAAIHLLIAFSLLRAAKSATTPSFPITRAEFIKDREWIQTLRPPAKSND